MLIVENVFYPEEFRSSYIKEHPKYEIDLVALIERSGFKGKFCGMYMQRLRFLEEYGKACVKRKSWFELLKHVDGEIYSIRFKSQKNIRILFCFIEYLKVEYAVLLYPFEEKEKNKGKSKDSYDHAVTIALSRRKEVLRDV